MIEERKQKYIWGIFTLYFVTWPFHNCLFNQYKNFMELMLAMNKEQHN